MVENYKCKQGNKKIQFRKRLAGRDAAVEAQMVLEDLLPKSDLIIIIVIMMMTMIKIMMIMMTTTIKIMMVRIMTMIKSK